MVTFPTQRQPKYPTRVASYEVGNRGSSDEKAWFWLHLQGGVGVACVPKLSSTTVAELWPTSLDEESEDWIGSG